MSQENDSGSVRSLSVADRIWIELAAELTPAKILDRTSRTDNTVAIVGAAISGFAVFGAKLPALATIPRTLAIAAALAAALAVVSIITYQIASSPRFINVGNLTEVQESFKRQLRGRLIADIGLYLLILSIVLAIGAGVSAVATAPAAQPALTVSQAPSTSDDSGLARTEILTIKSVFHGPPQGQAATTTVTAGSGQVLASSAVTPTSDGTATDTLTVGHIPVSVQLTVSATTSGQHCQAALGPGHQSPAITCG